MLEEVLRFLQQHKSRYVSGEYISEQLHITRAAVWKHIKALREDGFEIESAPRKGYMLVQEGNTLHSAQITAALHTRILGHNFHALQSAPSTNLVAKTLAAEGCPHGTAVIAEEQTAGRGRLGRGWVNAQGQDLCMSLVLRPALETRHAPRYTLATALGIARLAQAHALPTSIKWPNDVLIHEKKLCGILLELSGDMDHLDAIIIGMGLNINNTSFPAEFSQRTTSMALEAGHSFSRAQLAAQLLDILEPLYDACELDEPFTTQILARYRALCGTIGQEIDVHGIRGSLHGFVEGVDDTGLLLLRTADGLLHTLSAGDVSLRRAPETQEGQ